MGGDFAPGNCMKTPSCKERHFHDYEAATFVCRDCGFWLFDADGQENTPISRVEDL
jgi:hypothetical protein